MTHPILTDLKALARNRGRATADGLFLHRLVAEDIQDRLSIVNREFKDPVLVTPFPDEWQSFAEALPGSARVIEPADVLDLQPEEADLIIHVMDLHWRSDPIGQLIQCRRALRPDGFFLGTLFGGRTLNELRTALTQAEIDVTGGLSPRVAPMGEVRDLGGLLQRAGLALPVADSDVLPVTFSSPLKLLQDLRAMGEANALNDRLRHPTRRAVFLRMMELYLGLHGNSEGQVPATFEIITLTGWAPDASQQKPLRPGSAVASLAEALNTSETPLKG